MNLNYYIKTFRHFQFVFFLIVFFNYNYSSPVSSEKIPIGLVFEQKTDEIQSSFKFAMLQHSNRTRLEFDLYADVINTADAFKLSRLICNQFGRGVITMMGAVSPDSFDTLHSYSNTFQMPFITPWFPEKVIPPSSKTVDYALSLRPDYHRAVIDTVAFYGWKNVIYIYDSHDGLLRLQQLYTSLHPGRATFRISNVKRVANGSDVVEFLNSIERLDRWSNKYVILDSSTQLAKETIILHVRDVHLGRRNYHYFLSGLVMDDRWDKRVTEFGAINITGFRVLDRSKQQVLDFFTAWKSDSISAQAALMHDGVLVLIDSFQRLMKKKPDFLKAALRRTPGSNSSKFIDCNPSKDIVSPYEYGEKISRMMKKVEVTGLTGHVRFDELGHRKNFTLQVMEMNVDRDLIKVATWYDHQGLIPEKGREPAVNVPFIYDRNKTYIVSTIEETPYAMRNSGENSANDPYKGFCVDLTKMLADALEIKYDIQFVKDGLYGAENPKRIGGWDGMIGELLRKEVDLIIAPLTVTLQREQVIDFSRPFLSFDIEHNMNNSSGSDSIFSFLDPLSTELWLCIICSIFAVSIVLFIVSRFSPYEWRLVTYTDSQSSEQADVVATTKTTVINEFSFWNSLWFSLGSFMQQGSDITPRSISGRIVCVVWYTFTLIFVCFYTANLASSLTLARMSDNDYCKVTSCPLDTIAVTKTAHSNRASDDYGWFAYLLDNSAETEEASKIKPCEMIVTPKNNGFKEFAVGVPKGSQLRDGVNLVLNILKENGQMNKLIQKWFVKQECSVAQQINQGNELTLGNLAGLFYVLMGGMGLSLTVALLEFCYYGRAEAARANVPLRAALTAKARLATRAERKSAPNRTLQREHDRLGWNGGAYAGYYTPANQIGQEETALHASFTQV